METDVTYFTRSLPSFIRLQPLAGMRLGEIEWIPQKCVADSQAYKKNAILKGWWEALPLNQMDVLCVHGAQDGALYPFLLSWLEQDPKRHVLFLEEDPQIILALLHTKQGCQIVEHPQMGLYWLEGGEPQRMLITQLTWDFLQSRWHVVSHPTIFSGKVVSHQEDHQALHEEIESIRIHINMLARELLSYGKDYFTNFYENLPMLGSSYCGDRLFKRFRDLPIIICGSGPSLQGQIELLRSLSDRALIIAAGSAVPVLLGAGIIPHFGVAIDPTLSQAERLEGQIGLDIPYFYRPRLHPRALRAIKGRRLYVCGAGAYETALYVEQRLGLPAPQVEEGYNVLHFALSIAHALQGPSSRSPLILLGADGSYQGDREYSPGIPKSSRSQTESDHFKTTRQDKEGNVLVTRKEWLAERAWFTQFAHDHPKKLFINATAEGLPIEGIPYLALADCVMRYCTRCYDVAGRVWSELQCINMPSWTVLRLKKILNEWKQSLKRIEESMQAAQNEIANNHWHLVACAETVWQCESAYHPILALFERIVLRLQKVQEERAKRLAEEKGTEGKTEEQRLFTERLAFLQHATELHLSLINKIWESAQEVTQERLPCLHGVDRRRVIQSSTKHGEAPETGKITFKSHTGILLAEGYFKDMLRHGLQRHFYPDGTLAWEGEYALGIAMGIHRTFWPSGELKQAVDYTS